MAVAIDTAPGAARLPAVRAWWRTTHPPPGVAQRLDLLYTVVIASAILGALAYGTASTALADIVTPTWVAIYGPGLGAVATLLVAHWGAYQGPVVFSVADVMFLLGAPLPRRALVIRRLGLALAGGAFAGTVLAGVALVGLAGANRDVDPTRGAGLVTGLAALGTLGVCAAWAVQRSAAAERLLRQGTWVAALGAVALTGLAHAGAIGREVALWSGPWGWAVQSNARLGQGQWLPALAATLVAAGAGVMAALRSSGDAPGERHLRRAEARAGAVASLYAYDGRAARQALGEVGGRRESRRVVEIGWLRAALAKRPRLWTQALVIVWRDLVATARAPARCLWAAGLASAGTALALVDLEKPLAVTAGLLLLYVAASRMLWPLRTEFDAPSRMTVLLRPRPGRIVLAHVLLPALVTTVGASLGVLGCAITGALPTGGPQAALAAIASAPMLTACAGMSARRGGRLPQSIVMKAVAVDPSGGGTAVLTWLLWWPLVAASATAPPMLVIAAEPASWPIALGWLLAGTVGLGALLRLDPRPT